MSFHPSSIRTGDPVKLSYDDRTHAYWLDGKRCKSISSVAKIPDDTYSLDQWRKRQLLIGVALLPELAERAAAHFDDRDHLDRMAEEAMAAAKSHTAAARGTAVHRITERIDLNELIIDTPQAQAVRAAWSKALEIAGLEIVPELVERIVVYPEWRIAGRFDRLARRKGDGKLCVLDVKTGSSAVKYPHSVAVQLALYANAPLMAAPLPREGGKTEVFEPLPDVDTSVGYVVHMPNDEEVDVVGVDLEQGWKGAQTCFAVLDWRNSRELLIPVTEVPVTDPEPADRAGWITGRLAAIAERGPEAKQLAARAWPAGIGPKPPWRDEQIDQLDQALAQVEARIEAPFAEPDPVRPQPVAVAEPPTVPAPPLPEKPADSALLTDSEFHLVRQLIAALPEEQRTRMRVWSADGQRAGRPWAGTRDGMYRRHAAITRAVAECVGTLRTADEQKIRAALADLLGTRLHDTWETGAVLGCLTEEQAHALADFAVTSGGTPAAMAAN